MGKILFTIFLLNFANVKVIYFDLYCCKTQNFGFSASGKKFLQKRIHEISGSLLILKLNTKLIFKHARKQTKRAAT